MHRFFKKGYLLYLRLQKRKLMGHEVGGKELLTVRSQRERDERKIKWRDFPDRLGSCLHYIYTFYTFIPCM